MSIGTHTLPTFGDTPKALWPYVSRYGYGAPVSTTGDARALLTIQEAAEVLRISVSTLRRWDREGKLPAVRLGGARLMRYRAEDLHAFIGAAT